MSLTGDWAANIMMNAILGAKDHGASKQEALQHGKDVLNQIINIENNQVVTHIGISPHIWVDGLSITGE